MGRMAPKVAKSQKSNDATYFRAGTQSRINVAQVLMFANFIS